TPGNASVALGWSAPASNGGATVTSYDVYRTPAGGSESLLTTLDASFTTYNDTTVANGTTYAYRVSAVNAAGEGAKSNQLSPTPATVPSAPGLSVAGGNGFVTLTWSAPSANGSSIT